MNKLDTLDHPMHGLQRPSGTYIVVLEITTRIMQSNSCIYIVVVHVHS